MIHSIRYKLQSVPAMLPTVFVFLIIAYSVYFSIFELIPAITAWYHGAIPDDNARHLFFRAAPETIAASFGAQAVITRFVKFRKVEGSDKKEKYLKQYKMMKMHQLLYWPILGIIASVPGAALYAGIQWLWNKHYDKIKTLVANQHIMDHIHNTTILNMARNPSVISQIETFITTDGQKKLVVLAGTLGAAFVMKRMYWNVQGWFAERNVMQNNMLGKLNWYHNLVPAYVDRVNWIADNNGPYNAENHQRKNEIFLWISGIIATMAFGGGLYILLVVSHQH